MFSKNNFQKLLKQGRGAAMLWVKEYSDDDLSEVILDAYLHVRQYDIQCEGSRAPWLHQLISLTSNPEFYHGELLNQNVNNIDERDAVQQIELLGLLAAEGNALAKKALYEFLYHNQMFLNETALEQIIKLDGLGGLIFAADHFGKALQQHEDFFADDHFITLEFASLKGVDCKQELIKASKSNINIKNYLDAVEEYTESFSKPDKAPKVFQTTAMIERIKREPEKVGRWEAMRVRRHANAKNIQLFYEAICIEARDECLIHLLSPFWHNFRLPDLPENLLPLIHSKNIALRDAVVRALATLKHEKIRRIGLSLLDAGDLKAVELLHYSIKPEDFKGVEKLFSIEFSDVDDLHWFGLDLLALCEDNLCLEAIASLKWLYAESPCSQCREEAVRALIKLEALPCDLAYEAMYDCEEGTCCIAKLYLDEHCQSLVI